MSFRVGNQGYNIFPECLLRKVAAITYEPLAKVDLSRYPRGEPKALWAQLESSQKASLRRVAYDMKARDVIYVKHSTKIVGKGLVTGSYAFDARFRIVDPKGIPWAHQVPVEWSRDFPVVDVLLGAEQLTVKRLTQAEVQRIEGAEVAALGAQTSLEAAEGEQYTSEAAFRSRNRALINAKKAASDCRCEACGMSFREFYGRIGEGFIIAHHVQPVSHGLRTTTLDDIALLCANCHAMVHRKNPPIRVAELRRFVAKGPG